MDRNPVLFLTYWYPNKNNKSLGIFTKRHAQAIALYNDVTVLSVVISKGNALFKKSSSVFRDEKNIETHQICLESRYNKILYVLLPLHYLILRSYILGHFGKNKFRILHSNVIFPCGIVGHWLAKTLHCGHLITEHWTKIDKFFKKSFYKFAGKNALDAAGRLTFVSLQLANTVSKYTNNSRISIVPNVIDPHEFYFDPLVKKNDTFTFIAAAHWSQFKNPFYFLNALNSIAAEGSIGRFKVVLAGEGEQLMQVKKNNYLFPIEYPGNLSPQQLNAALNKSHVFLHGSDFETFSVIIAEALICGLPSVVSPYGIALEAINTSNGFVTDNSYADWKQKIIKCYNSVYEPQQIANQLKQQYGPEQVGNLFSKLYQSIG